METLRRLETLHGFVVPRTALPALRSLVKIGLRLPADAVAVRLVPPQGVPMATFYGADLATACGASLVAIDLDVDRRDAAAVVVAFTDGFTSAHRPTPSPLRSFRIHDVAAAGHYPILFDGRLRPVPLRAFCPRRFPQLQTVSIRSLTWDVDGLDSTHFESADQLRGVEAAVPSGLTRLNVNAPTSLEVLSAIGRLAGASLRTLEIKTDMSNLNATVVMDGAGVLEAHFSALEYLTAPQLCVSGWRCSRQRVLRVVSVALHADAVAEFMQQVAKCPLIERVCVRNVATRGVDAFVARDDHPPHPNVLAPFRVGRCPRLIAVDGIYGCEPPREGGEFVPRSNGLLWELASFG